MNPFIRALAALTLIVGCAACGDPDGMLDEVPDEMPDEPVEMPEEPADMPEEPEAPDERPDEFARGPILTLGDSIFDFHETAGRDIPEIIGDRLGRTVVDRSQGGAQFAPEEPEDDGFDIRGQYADGDWSWVVLDGGGNDVNDQCGCGDCGDVLDGLIGEDGLTGEIPDFVRAVIDEGSRVLFVGYYGIPDDAAFGFDRCVDELEAHSVRLQRMADAIDGAWFVSAGEVVSPGERSLYDDDRVHPSVQGSRVVGEHIAATIAAIEAE